MLYYIAYTVSYGLQWVSAILALLLGGMKKNTVMRLSIKDLSIKLRFFAFAAVFLAMLGTAKGDTAAFSISYTTYFHTFFLVWLAVSILSFILRLFNPLKVHVLLNIVSAGIFFAIDRLIR